MVVAVAQFCLLLSVCRISLYDQWLEFWISNHWAQTCLTPQIIMSSVLFSSFVVILFPNSFLVSQHSAIKLNQVFISNKIQDLVFNYDGRARFCDLKLQFFLIWVYVHIKTFIKEARWQIVISSDDGWRYVSERVGGREERTIMKFSIATVLLHEE